MAVPKRKKSKAMRDHRRAQWMRSVPKPSVTQCPKCQEPKLPHRVCAACGFVFNAAYDPALQDYSLSYEETQAFSPRFVAFMRELAAEWIERFGGQQN